MNRGTRARRAWPQMAGLLVLLLLISGTGAAPVRAQAAPAIRLSVDTGDAAISTPYTTTVTGSGFAAGSSITVTVEAPRDGLLDPIEVVSSRAVTPATTGSFSVSVPVPVFKREGVWTVRARQGTASDSAPFYAFVWSLSPNQGGPGTAVTVNGTFFPPSRNLSFTWVTSANTSAGAFFQAAGGSNGVLRATTTAPAGVSPGANTVRFEHAPGLVARRTFTVPVDLTVTHIELTQVVQRWDNSIPLVVRKPTAVRVYVQADAAGFSATGARVRVDRVRIAGTRDGTALGTFDITTPVDVAPRPVDPKTLRPAANLTFNALLPTAWVSTAGANSVLSITATVNPTGTLAETSSSNNSLTRAAALAPVSPFTFVGLRYQDPDISASRNNSAAFETFRQYLQRTWPVNTVNHVTPANDIFEWKTLADEPGPYEPATRYLACHDVVNAVNARAMAATAPTNTYPHLVISPVRTAGTGGPRGGCATQNGLGSLVTDDVRTTFTSEGSPIAGIVASQELSHNLGLRHSGHAPDDPNCCIHSGISDNVLDAAYGWDTATMTPVVPGTPAEGQSHAHDVMTDVLQSGFVWPSDYMYERLLRRFRLVQLSRAEMPLLAPGEYGYGVWEAKQDAPAMMAAIVVRGRIGGDNRPALTQLLTAQRAVWPFMVADTARLDATWQMEMEAAMVDTGAGEGPFTLALLDAEGAELVTRRFDLDYFAMHMDSFGAFAFSQALPYDVRARTVVLRLNDRELARLGSSAQAPQVRILTPAAGAHWQGARQVTWEATDADGDRLVYAVQYSSDGGQTWSTLGSELTETALEVDAELLAGSPDCLVRVIASDGMHTTIAVSGVFGVERHQPAAGIMGTPVVMETGQLAINGMGEDMDDGPLAAEQLVWSSDIEGELGAGQMLVTMPLTPGRHRITLRVQDRDGNVATAEHSIDVPERPEEGDQE